MTRVNVYSYPAGDADDSPVLQGWFDLDKAASWTDRDHNGNGSGGTGRGQAIYRTSGGKWVLEHWTCWQGEKDRFGYVSADEAREWLLRHDEDAAVAEHFGPVPDEEDRRPGRPSVGEPVNVRLGDELLAMVDAYAASGSISRAEAVRRLVADAVTRARVNDGVPLAAPQEDGIAWEIEVRTAAGSLVGGTGVVTDGVNWHEAVHAASRRLREEDSQ